MNAFEALRGVRVGCVQYLNSRPLIHGLEGVHLSHPRELAQALSGKSLDVALVPVFEALRAPDLYQLVDGVGIASHGPVYSVFVAHRGPMESAVSIVADPASLTSIHLLQVLCEGVLGRKIPLVSPASAPGGDDRAARLLIGNQAIEFRRKPSSCAFHFWDLGEAWTRWTGLPFVYALWVIRRDCPRIGEVAEALREVARHGRASVREIARKEGEFGEEFSLRYLTEHISFDVGPAEKRGIERFRSELVARGFVPQGGPLEFV